MPFDAPEWYVIAGGIVFGIFRLVAGFGLLKNLKWGLVLSAIAYVVTVPMIFEYMPFGIMDGALAVSALILIVMQYFGSQKAID